MPKHVIVVASGETERRVLPRLVRHLRARGIIAEDVRIPPRNMALNVEMAERLIKAAWYESLDAPPDKFVVVMDVDRADPAEVLAPMRAQLPDRVREVEADVLYAYAQAHLEAWYFADADNLRLAGTLDATRIAQRSPSFRTLVDAVLNGSGGAVPLPPNRRQPVAEVVRDWG